jgi:hypothetical protein
MEALHEPDDLIRMTGTTFDSPSGLRRPLLYQLSYRAVRRRGTAERHVAGDS